MSRSSLLALAGLLAGFPLAAQQPASAPPSVALPTFAWFIGLGGHHSDWGDVQTAFSSTGYDGPRHWAAAVGGGAYWVRGRVLLGAEGFSYEGTSIVSSGGRDLRAAGGGGFLTVGYLGVNRLRMRAYPYLGIGGVGATFRINTIGGVGLGPPANDVSFNQVLIQPGHRSVLSAGGLAVELGAGADFAPGLHATRRGCYGLLVGVRAGYQLAARGSDWRLYDVDVAGGPNRIGNAFFLRFSVGGTGRSRGARPAGGVGPCAQSPSSSPSPGGGN